MVSVVEVPQPQAGAAAGSAQPQAGAAAGAAQPQDGAAAGAAQPQEGAGAGAHVGAGALQELAAFLA